MLNKELRCHARTNRKETGSGNLGAYDCAGSLFRNIIHVYIENNCPGAGEMVQPLRVFTAHARDLGSGSSNRIKMPTPPTTLAPGNPVPLSGLPGHLNTHVYIHTHTH